MTDSPGLAQSLSALWVTSGEFAVLEIDGPPSYSPGGAVRLAARFPSPAALAFVRELLIEVGLDPDISL